MLKTELHAHTADDPHDAIPHTARQLIDHAVALGYQALAITLHGRQLDIEPLVPYARERGLALIRGVEALVYRRDVLLINFPAEAERVRSFEDIASLKSTYPTGLVVAPHPFFPAPRCLWGYMNTHADLFDAVELNAMRTRLVDFNGAAVRWAKRHGKPVVGNSDVHFLAQLGTTYSLVDAEPTADSVCAAIRAGRVQVRSEPLSVARAAQLCTKIVASGWRWRAA